MNDLIETLALARTILASEKANMDAVKADIEVAFGKRLAIAKKQLAEAKMAVQEAECSVRNKAEYQYAQDGNKRPHPAVQIKVFRVLRYRVEDAIEYARVFAPNALRLDKRVFEKAAKDTLKVIESGVHIGDAGKVLPATVSLEDDPRATIARDLGGY